MRIAGKNDVTDRQAEIINKRTAYAIANNQLRMIGTVFGSGVGTIALSVFTVLSLISALRDDMYGNEAVGFGLKFESNNWGTGAQCFIGAIVMGLMTLYQADRCFRYYQENNLFPLPKAERDKGLLAMVDYRVRGPAD